MEVFIVLFNSVIYSGETLREFQPKLLRSLFAMVFEQQNQTQFCENVL